MSKIGTLVFLLVVVVAAFIGLYYSAGYCDDELIESSTSSSQVYVEVLGEKEISQNRDIVSDKFVSDVENDGKVVAISSDGQAYIVKNGQVLVSDMVVKSNQEEYSVYRIDNPEFSVSSN